MGSWGTSIANAIKNSRAKCVKQGYFAVTMAIMYKFQYSLQIPIVVNRRIPRRVNAIQAGRGISVDINHIQVA